MSVQIKLPDFSVVTPCPLVLNPYDSVLTYQTASSVALNKNVNGHSSECFPDDYAYLQNRPIQKPSQCCSNNALKVQVQRKNIVGMMSYGY
jgi:hypothetical protein